MDLTYDEEKDQWRVDWERMDMDNTNLDCLLFGGSDLDALDDLTCYYR